MAEVLNPDYKKTVQSLNFFAVKEGGRIDKLKAIKLLWLADRFHIRKFGSPITNDIYFAMGLGPVGSLAKDLIAQDPSFEAPEIEYSKEYLKKINNTTFESIRGVDAKVLSDAEKESLKFAFNNFKQFKGIQLARISHVFPEWEKFQSKIEKEGVPRVQMDYIDFFKNPECETSETTKFEVEAEELEEAKKAFIEKQDIAKLWE